MDLWEKWKGLSSVAKSVWIAFGVLATLGGAIGFLNSYIPSRWLETAVPRLLEDSTETHAVKLGEGNYLFSPDIAAVIAVGMGLVFVVLLVSIIHCIILGSACHRLEKGDIPRLMSELEGARLGLEDAQKRVLDVTNELTARNEDIHRLEAVVKEARLDLKNFIDRLHRITYQQYRIDDIPLFEFRSVTWDVKVKANGDADVSHIYELCPRGQTGHVWTPSISVDEESDPVESAFGIDIRACDLGNDGNDVELLPRVNDPLSKKYALFFLPQIQPDEVRRIQIAYTWPGWANRLLQKDRFEVFWNYSRAVEGTKTDFDISVEFAKGLGKITCTKPSPKVDGETLEEAHDGEGVTWRYEAKKAPPKLRYSLVFDRVTDEGG
jgi:hypothetical protein